MKDETVYDYYAERLAQVMLQEELITEDDQREMEQFIRGCA